MRSQHAGGLIENEKLSSCQEQFYDFDLLPFSQRQVAHRGARIDAKTVAFRYCVDLAVQPRSRQHKWNLGKDQRNVFRHGERGYQREALEHHADTVAATFT